MIPKTHELLHPKGLFAALWPYRFSAMIFGHCNSDSKKFRAIYSIVMVSASFLYSYFVAYDLFKFGIRNRGSDMQILIAYFRFWFQVIFVPIHILVWFSSGHSCYKELVGSLMSVDRKLAQICSRHVNPRVTVIRQIICLFLPVSFAVILIVDDNYSESKTKISSWQVFETIAYHYSRIIEIASMSFFGNLVCFIGDRYAIINCGLKGIDSNVRIESVENLSRMIFDDVKLTRQLRDAHRKLFFVSQKVMQVFAIQVFTCVMSSFSSTVYDLYTEYKIGTPSSGEWIIRRILAVVIRILFNFGVVIYVAYSCHQTVREANGTTKILNSLKIETEDLRLEVSSFSYQLIHYQLHFSPLGFFQLDLALVQSMVGSIVTYLVILVQMDNSVSSEKT